MGSFLLIHYGLSFPPSLPMLKCNLICISICRQSCNTESCNINSCKIGSCNTRSCNTESCNTESCNTESCNRLTESCNIKLEKIALDEH